MKVLKAGLALVGIVGLIGAAVFLFLNYIDTRSLLAAANANKSGNLLPDPMPRVYLTAAVAGLGGLLLGLGLGLPPRTAATVERHTLEGVNARRSDAIAARALGGSAVAGSDAQPAVAGPDAPPAVTGSDTPPAAGSDAGPDAPHEGRP